MQIIEGGAFNMPSRPADTTPRSDRDRGKIGGYLPTYGRTGTGIPWGNRLQPPMPQFNPDGNITHGYSYRFESDLHVTGKNGEDGAADANDKFDNAFLQI
jgi:hypothetical protein